MAIIFAAVLIGFLNTVSNAVSQAKRRIEY